MGNHHLHDLQATAITAWQAQGIDPETAAALAAHSDMKVTLDIYSEATMLRMRESIERAG